ncbi:NUDIX hydrolase [Seohaeicola nanhaiensis]|uniref:NUDIX hydrolase n=1 Tax=Seohaeicola nanhaiensis TaxID=1387282 RepID=A0ABV9KA25_9RHOB
MAVQAPSADSSATEEEIGRQFAALCFTTVRGKTRVLLITSRGTGRWIVPKGWKVEGATAAGSAAREAWEEAGVVGRIYDHCLGTYSYIKLDDKGPDLPCKAQIFPVKVLSLKGDFPERNQRRRKWFSLKKAAELVDEPELAEILRSFDPGTLPAAVKS